MLRVLCWQFIRRVRAAAGSAAWLPLLVLGSQSCSNSPTEPATPQGALLVAVDIPPFSVSTYVVQGPDSYDNLFAGTDTIILPIGTYLIGSAIAQSIDPIVTSLFTGVVTDSIATIKQDDTTHASISFVTAPGTGGLWVGSANGGSPRVAKYTTVELQGGTPPAFTVPTGGTVVVFDASGNMWVGSPTSNTISEYLAAQLVNGGSTTPVVTIGGSGLHGLYGLAFDPSGNLWASNFSGNSIVEYAASQLLSSGSPVPVVEITSAALSNPAGFSFDAYGNLWVPNAGSNTVIQFTRAQVAVGGNLTPSLAIIPIGGSVASPHALAFDLTGNLWVANQANNTVSVYGPGQIVAGGALVPNLTFTVPSQNKGLSAMAFDNSGDLWLTCVTSSQLIVFTGDQLSTTVNPPPLQVIETAAAPASLAFNPRLDGLPLGGVANSRVKRHELTTLGTPHFKLRGVVQR